MEQRKQIIFVFFFTLLIFVFYQLLRIFSPFFEAFFWAAILAYAFYPMHLVMLRLVRVRSAAALATTVLIVLIVLPPSLYVLKNLLDQTLELYQQVRNFVGGGGLESLIQSIQSYSWFQHFQEKVMSSNLLKQSVSNALLRVSQELTNLATSQVKIITKNIVLIFLNMILVIFVMFFLLRDGERIYHSVYNVVPLEDRDRKTIFSKINEVFSGVIRGQFLTSLVQGILTGMTFFFLGLPAPSFFGFITFLCSMIPVTGASTVWVPFAIYLFLTQQMKQAAILTGVGILVISLSDNVLKPLVIGEKTKIPVFLLFFGILGGLKAFGMTGIFLGPVFISVFFALIKIYQERYPAAH